MKIKMIIPIILFLCILSVFMQAYKVVLPVTIIVVNTTLEKLKIKQSDLIILELT